MFRYEIGARILVRRNDWTGLHEEDIEVKILDKVPNRIKVQVLSEGWFRVGGIYWLSAYGWFSVARVKEVKDEQG